MANPKRKTSKAKKKRRRSHWMAKGEVTLTPCPQCRKSILPHSLCPHCGFYKDKKVVTTRGEKIQAKKSKE